MPVTHWTLFVDESGSFDRGHPDALAAGLLVERRWTPTLERQLAGQVAAAAPGIVSPPHAWTLKSAEKFRKGLDEGDVELSPDAARALRREDAPATEARLAGYRGGLADVLKRTPGLTGARVVVLGASSDREGHCRALRYGQVRGDAYVEALAALLTRVVLLVREPGADVVVSAHVATRNVVHDDLGTSTDLSPALLAQVADAVTGRLPGGDRVRFVAERVEKYDGKCAGVVLADTVSNSYFVATCDGVISDWGSVVGHADSQWHLAAELSTPATRGEPLPTFTAAGRAHEALVAVANGDNPLPVTGGRRAWIGQQATAWIGVLS